MSDRIDIAIESVVGPLLNQSMPGKLPMKNSSAYLMAGLWLLAAFIIATVYRTNLTASLTLPKYPSRTETLTQLVASGSE